MNAELLRQKLIAAARKDVASDHVPYAFEKRIMAGLASRTLADSWAAWGTVPWRAVAPCAAIMLLVAVGSLTLGGTSHDLGDDLDAALLADLDPGADAP